MSMNRRDFSLASAALGLACVAPAAHAQGAPFIAGQDYAVLRKPAPTDAPAGKIEVLEFFSYNCPHCATFEPALEAWSKKLPANAVLRRVPVPFVGQDVQTKQKLYYALEAMGKVDELHMKVFQAMHFGGPGQRMFGDAAVLEWVGKQPGINAKKFEEIFKSFGVASKIQRADQLTQAYEIPGTPAIGVAGRWYVDSGMGKTLQRMLQICNYLIGQAAKA